MPKFHYQCTTCHREYPPEQATRLCPYCEKDNQPAPPKSALKTLYNYGSLSRKTDFPRWEQEQFLPLLPITSAGSLPNLRVGNTPVYELHKLGKAPLPFRLYLKDDSRNSTYSFKDRASALVSAYAWQQGWKTIVADSSIAGICATQGQQAVVFVPTSAPLAKLTQILMYGACIVPVEGNYDQDFELRARPLLHPAGCTRPGVPARNADGPPERAGLSGQEGHPQPEVLHLGGTAGKACGRTEPAVGRSQLLAADVRAGGGVG